MSKLFYIWTIIILQKIIFNGSIIYTFGSLLFWNIFCIIFELITRVYITFVLKHLLLFVTYCMKYFIISYRYNRTKEILYIIYFTNMILLLYSISSTMAYRCECDLWDHLLWPLLSRGMWSISWLNSKDYIFLFVLSNYR